MLRAASLWVCSGLAVCLGVVAEVRAQPTAEPALSAGARVRVTVGAPVAERHLGAFSSRPVGRLVGTLEAVRGDTLVLREKTLQLVPVDSVWLLEVSRGRHRETWSGAAIGFAIGAVAGGLSGALLSSSCESWSGGAPETMPLLSRHLKHGESRSTAPDLRDSSPPLQVRERIAGRE